MEMKCIVCNKSIPKGQRFVGNRYKDKKFCCENCYNQFCQQKDMAKEKAKIETAKRQQLLKEKNKSPWRKMTDYIDSLYPPNAINWPAFTKQIKSFMEEYDLTSDEIRLTIRYAVEFEGVVVNPEWGIGQFIPAYIEPTKRFREKLHSNQEEAKNITNESAPVIYIKKKSTQRKYYGKVEDFDE